MNIVQLNTVNLGDNIIVKGNGGSSSSKTAGDVTYYDYDGTVLHSYTAEAFAALTEHPALPERDGLICQEWNWSLTEAQGYVAKYGSIDIGATYITDDGKTRLFIKLDYPIEVGVTTSAQTEGDTIIDWGDGVIETHESEYKKVFHSYQKRGEYVIQVWGTEGEHSFWTNVFSEYRTVPYLVGIHLGNISDFRADVFPNVEFITLPKNALSSNYSEASNLGKIRCLVIPKSIHPEMRTDWAGCWNLRIAIQPAGNFLYNNYLDGAVLVKNKSKLNRNARYGGVMHVELEDDSIYQEMFDKNPSLRFEVKSLHRIVVPEGVTTLNRTFSNCNNLEEVSLPDTLTTINASFGYCYTLNHIKFPSSINSIQGQAFFRCLGMQFYDFADAAAVPTMSSSDAFYDIPTDCKIIVPDALYDEWIVATNWATYASQIIKKSEWDAQQTA
ncbi:MAG: leucine-rich repeat domain-containing protein [Alistipes sp.]|nr:leucine-rich repeat domain-containing protein [Alistipes sp.]